MPRLGSISAGSLWEVHSLIIFSPFSILWDVWVYPSLNGSGKTVACLGSSFSFLSLFEQGGGGGSASRHRPVNVCPFIIAPCMQQVSRQ